MITGSQRCNAMRRLGFLGVFGFLCDTSPPEVLRYAFARSVTGLILVQRRFVAIEQHLQCRLTDLQMTASNSASDMMLLAPVSNGLF